MIRNSFSGLAGIVFGLIILLFTVQCSSLPTAVESLKTSSQTYGLVYYSSREEKLYIQNLGKLYLTNLSTGKETLLMADGAMSIYEPFSWSPRAKKIVYPEHKRSDGLPYDRVLYLLDLEGHKTQLTENEVNVGFPQWHPNGKMISYWTSLSPPGFYTVNPDAEMSPQLLLEDASFVESNIAWSPNGQIFTVTIPDSLGMHVQNFQLIAYPSGDVLATPSDNIVRAGYSWSFDTLILRKIRCIEFCTCKIRQVESCKCKIR